MTAAIETRPATRPPERPVPRRSRRLLAATALVAVIAAAWVVRPGGQVDMHDHVPLDPAVRGTYQLDDGRHLTLWGTEQSPSYELDGRVTSLEREGTDRYRSTAGNESLSVVRNTTGAVQGVALQRGAQPPTLASWDPLHGEQELRFTSPGADLAGTLLIPHGPGPHPAVVLVHGADRGRRDGIYRLLGSHLARRGVATLTYDKRGVGESSGSHAQATFDDLTADALAGVDALAGHPAVDPQRVGVLGFSQGGWIVAEAAQRSDDVAFVAAFSASGFSPGDQQAWLHGSMLVARGFDQPAMVIADRVSRMLYSTLDLVDAGLIPPIPHVPGFWFHALDPHQDTSALWEGVRQPVLLAWGALDCQVPAQDSMIALSEALAHGGNRDVTTTVLPDADHSFMIVEACGHETGLAHHDVVDFADGYLGLAADWITSLDGRARVELSPQAVDQAEDAVLAWHLDPPTPAPWYGTFVAQLATLAGLLAIFTAVAGRWVVSLAGRRHKTRAGHLTGMAALTGLLATVTVFAAFAEIAMLGATHAAFLVGGPIVDGASVLMNAARVLVVLAGGLTAAALLTTIRGLRRPASSLPSGRTIWIVAGAGVALVTWAAYWRLVPML